MDEQPLDYVAAAIAYLMYDNQDCRSHQTIETLTARLNETYQANLPFDAIACALSILDEQSLVAVITSRFAPQYYSAASSFSEKLAAWRFEKTSTAAIVLDKFMNGPAFWMREALGSEHFKKALGRQLTPVPGAQDERAVELPSTPSVFLRNASLLNAELDVALKKLDEFGIGNAEKAQAHALLLASKALAEAPEPPINLIWDLVQRANNIAGIASLMVAILALFVSR